MNTIEKKEYIKPELEIVEIAAEEAIAISGGGPVFGDEEWWKKTTYLKLQ